MTTTTDSEDPWSISVKAVGLTLVADDDEAAATVSETNANGERQFVVEVSPDDAVTSLHDKIEGATGLKASQQRLIYRGRLIGKCEQQEEEAKIKDIAGLCDGQTIHLVKKRDTQTEVAADPISEEGSSTQNASSRTSVDNDILGGSAGSGGSLLAAMLGLSSLPEDTNEEQNTTAATTATRGPRWGWRSSRLGGRTRRPHYRLTAEDIEVSDPGSMEAVRQGLMTLHTVLPHVRNNHSEQMSSPLQANREWYRGQWIDLRDTVNQWLEATIVEVLDPEDILPQGDIDQEDSEAPMSRYHRLPLVPNDPAVSAADLEGRRRLLIETCDPDDSDEEDGSLSGFRRRRSNDGVQVLLIHYNGWPHRWDEWIRGDSERIRPFRTRTRHPNVSATASPTPQAVFHDAPRTNMRSGDEAEDRAGLLPELFRAVSIVNDLLANVVDSSPNDARLGESYDDLPWDPPPSSAAASLVDDEAGMASETSSLDEKPSSEEPEPRSNRPAGFNRHQLQALAPLLDRLGRTLTDAAPHIASLADSLPVETSSSNGGNGSATLQDLPDLEGSHPPLGGFLSLWNRERRRQSIETEEAQSVQQSDPDHVDYVNGFVNTSRGEVRAGPRSRPQNDDVASLLGAYLAAASLGGVAGGDDDDNDEAGGGAQSLGRLLRERGNGAGGVSGGIDIHIHAVVTAPGGGGGGTGGLGLATRGGPIPAATVVGGGGGIGGGGGGRNLFSGSTGNRSPRTTGILRSRHSHTPTSSTHNPPDDIEESGLFSELYSENPESVDPNGSPEPDERRATLPLVMERDENDFMHRISSLREENELDSPVRVSSTRRNRPSPGPSSSRRQSSERRTGWGRLFRRRRSRSSHRDSV